MKVIGLTGSIGMGKSTVAQMFARCGVPCHDADKAVHDLMKSDGAAFDAIASIFPEAIEDGEINRKILGAIVFADENKKKILESILHPLVRAQSDEFVRQSRLKGLKAIILEIPLLFETAAQNRVDYVVCASAPHFIQKRRVLSRPSMSEEKFRQVLNSQWSDELKRCWSDFVINTARSKAQTMRDVKRIIARIY